MTLQKVWLARDGWRVQLADGPRRYVFGPQPTEAAAQQVAQRLITQWAAGPP